MGFSAVFRNRFKIGETEVKCGTDTTTSMHTFKYLPLMCWHSLDFSAGLKCFFGRAQSSHFLKFQSNIKAENTLGTLFLHLPEHHLLYLELH